MTNFIYAIVTIVYALVCLTKEAEQGRCSTSKSAEENFNIVAERDLGTMTLVERKKLI